VDAIFRASAKVLLVDPSGRVILFRGRDPDGTDDRPVWFAVGGGQEPGETPQEAALREVFEETGQEVADLGPVVLTRRFHWTFRGTLYDQEDTYFLVVMPHFEPTSMGWTDLEREVVLGHRWWSVDELRTTSDTVFPVGLADLLDAHLSQ
jgi:8-oxo-dGTP pyrophosphatase MutT (NUDIX family)